MFVVVTLFTENKGTEVTIVTGKTKTGQLKFKNIIKIMGAIL